MDHFHTEFLLQVGFLTTLVLPQPYIQGLFFGGFFGVVAICCSPDILPTFPLYFSDCLCADISGTNASETFFVEPLKFATL